MTVSAFRLASLFLAAALVVPAGDAAAQRAGGQGQGQGQERGASRDMNRGAPRAERSTEDRHHRGEDQRALSDAVRRVERRTGGQVLSAERVPFDGRDVNRVKVVDSSGRVRVYMDDPQNQPDRRRPEPPRDDD